MAGAVFRNLQEFQPDSETITAYLERAKVYFTVNDIGHCRQASGHTSHCHFCKDV